MRIRGIEMELHPSGEALSDHIRRENDFFEAEILDFIRDNYPVQRIIIDIGANIGNHALYFANFLKFYEYIICFEPVLENYEILEKNLRGYKGIFTYNYALSDKTQTLQMSANRSNMGASMVKLEGELTVQAYSLDRLYYKNVSLIKIDVEEYEPQVLDGAQDTIAKYKPLIIIEDWFNKYNSLLPVGYQCVQGWEIGKTYIYEWKGE